MIDFKKEFETGEFIICINMLSSKDSQIASNRFFVHLMSMNSNSEIFSLEKEQLSLEDEFFVDYFTAILNNRFNSFRENNNILISSNNSENYINYKKKQNNLFYDCQLSHLYNSQESFLKEKNNKDIINQLFFKENSLLEEERSKLTLNNLKRGNFGIDLSKFHNKNCIFFTDILKESQSLYFLKNYDTNAGVMNSVIKDSDNSYKFFQININYDFLSKYNNGNKINMPIFEKILLFSKSNILFNKNYRKTLKTSCYISIGKDKDSFYTDIVNDYNKLKECTLTFLTDAGHLKNSFGLDKINSLYKDKTDYGIDPRNLSKMFFNNEEFVNLYYNKIINNHFKKKAETMRDIWFDQIINIFPKNHSEVKNIYFHLCRIKSIIKFKNRFLRLIEYKKRQKSKVKKFLINKGHFSSYGRRIRTPAIFSDFCDFKKEINRVFKHRIKKLQKKLNLKDIKRKKKLRLPRKPNSIIFNYETIPENFLEFKTVYRRSLFNKKFLKSLSMHKYSYELIDYLEDNIEDLAIINKTDLNKYDGTIMMKKYQNYKNKISDIFDVFNIKTDIGFEFCQDQNIYNYFNTRKVRHASQSIINSLKRLGNDKLYISFG